MVSKNSKMSITFEDIRVNPVTFSLFRDVFFCEKSQDYLMVEITEKRAS